MSARKPKASFILVLLLAMAVTGSSFTQTAATAEAVTGTWRLRNSYQENEFKILALGKDKLKIQFSGLYKYRDGDGRRAANGGVGEGTTTIKGSVVTFVPDDTTDCKITLRFARGKLTVRQEGICGFGFNVNAEGVYKKVSGEKPKFD